MSDVSQPQSKTKKILHRFVAGLTLTACTGTFASPGVSVKQCEKMANSEIEHSYCAVLASGRGANLPNFHQFRQNPLKMQILLLKGPAKKAGIALPTGGHKHSAAPLKPTPVIDSPALDEPRPNKPSAATAGRESMQLPATPAAGVSSALQGCELQGQTVSCANQHYHLVSNLRLQELPATALSDENKLIFPERHGNDSLVQYLSKAYPVYIDKMLVLGLGDTTMSFTKFNAMFHETVKQGLSFKKRFEEMYELLKKERKTQAIKARYNNKTPPSIDQCMRLSSEIIVCDDVKQNWVYTAK